MKKSILTLAGFLCSAFLYSQSTDAGATGNNWGATKFLGWNNSNGTSPLLFKTNGFNRMRLNGIQSYSVAGSSQPRSGYLLLGAEMTLGADGPLYDRGPFSLLHLNGVNGTFVQQFGFRDWMKTGITLTDNNDLSYFGMRQIGTGNDVTETAIVWADNNGTTGSGPDDFAFRFTGSNSSNVYNQDFSNQGDVDGLHLARFTPTGQMGLGNTFGVSDGGILYTRPKSLLHMSYQFREGNPYEWGGFHQITYRRAFNEAADIIGQGEEATDGLRLGIDNNIFNLNVGTKYLNGYLRWQEASNFIIQTEDDNNPNIESNERMRFTSIGALVANHGNTYGGLITPAAASNTTRIGISHNGLIPVTKPLSLLHLGYQTFGGGNDGWRPWMDVGIYTSNGTDQVFLGLKPEAGSNVLGDRQDAVLNWGDNMTGAGSADNFRMIFTSAPGGTAPATGANGLEGMRMTPTTATGIFTGIGGDPTSNQYGPTGNSINPTATLEVNSWGNTNDAGGSSGLRFTNLNSTSPTIQNPAKGVLSVDTEGDVIYVPYPNGLACWDLDQNGIFDVATEDLNSNGIPDAGDCQGVPGPQGPAGTSTGAHNGTSVSTIDPSKVSLGNNLGATGGQLLSHREIPMNNYNMVFTDPTTNYNGNTNRIGIGTTTPTAKLDITMDPTLPYPVPVGLNISLNQASSNGQVIGQRMLIFGNNTTNTGLTISTAPGNAMTQGIISQIGGTSSTSSSHIGISTGCYVTGLPSTNTGVSSGAGSGRRNFGGAFTASGVNGSIRTTGVHAQANGTGAGELIGVHSQIGASGTGNNIGVWSQVLANTGLNIGVLSTINNALNPANRAGSFMGIIETSAASVITSDSMFKTDVSRMTGSLKLLQAVKPVTYYMDTINYAQFNFLGRKQFGFIAQQLETVFPNLVHESMFPAQYDSLGNEIAPAIPYKSVNYTALIPVNTQAILELNNKVDEISLSDQSIKTNVQDLTGSLQKVLDMRGVSYDWVHNVHPELNLDSANHVGFIAQEIAQIDPRLTFLTEDSLLHVKYEKVVPILAEAIEELNNEVSSKDSIINVLVIENDAQQAKIDDLNNRLSQLENCLSGILPYLCQLNQSAIKANTPAAQEEVRKNLSVTLSDRNTIILDQNVPNPFAEQTVINFSIPETVQKAQIHFYDGYGKLMNSVEVTERGLGSLTVFGSDLSTGVYTYTLVADGQVVATKKMMKQ